MIIWKVMFTWRPYFDRLSLLEQHLETELQNTTDGSSIASSAHNIKILKYGFEFVQYEMMRNIQNQKNHQK